MNVNKRREVEAKFFLGNSFQELELFKKELLQNGFVFEEKRIETDFLPDTKDGQLKANNILLRFRFIETINGMRRLLTFKKRRASRDLLDFDETETSLDNIHKETLLRINKTIAIVTGIQLTNEILGASSLAKLQELLVAIGLGRVRILLDKYREEYTKGSDHVTLDFFPGRMGSYLEVESYSADAVKKVYQSLGFEKNQIISTDYGDLLKEHKFGLTDLEQRIAQFTISERQTLLTGGKNA